MRIPDSHLSLREPRTWGFTTCSPLPANAPLQVLTWSSLFPDKTSQCLEGSHFRVSASPWLLKWTGGKWLLRGFLRNLTRLSLF